MEAVAVALMVVMPVGIAGAIGYAVMQYQKTLVAHRARVFADIASRYGLTAAAEGASGLYQGVPVVVALEFRKQGKSTITYTAVRARVHPPLDLGLSLRNQSWGGLGSLEALFYSGKDHQLGDPVLDAAFLIGGDEPHRIAALLTPAIRSMLVHATKTGTVVVNDHWVQIEERGEPRPEFVDWAVQSTVQIARAIEPARMQVPAATALARLVHGYQTAAAALGLSWMQTPLALGGTIEGIAVYSGAMRVGPHKFVAAVTASFPTSLGLGLSIRSTKELNTIDRLFISKDVPIGDDAFDDAFIVRTSDVGRLQRVFNKDVRDAIQRVGELGAIEIRDDALVVRMDTIPSAENTPPLIDRVARLAKAIHERVDREMVDQGPYR